MELLHLILRETFESSDMNDSRRLRKSFSRNSYVQSCHSNLKYVLQKPGSWEQAGDPPQKLNSLLNTAGSPRTRRYCPSFITVGRGWHFGGSYKIISVTWFEKWNIPGKTLCVYWVVCSRQLCESEMRKKVSSFELEWWSSTQICIYTLNFDLPYLYYYYYQFSGG